MHALLLTNMYSIPQQTKAQDFSVLKGVFVFTSGLIGREDPDDVNIDTPSGSIGIRGTIIAGDTNSGEITVVEGAIVLRDFAGNEMTLADFSAAAQLSCLDYTSDVDWNRHEVLKDWYAKIKSRPAFRSILADEVPGFQPAAHYADLDF